MILPGATLGILGGGQLGRMFTMAARTLGYRVIVLDPSADSPAGRVADAYWRAAFDDERTLEQLGRACAVVTTEFENVPAQALRLLSSWCTVRPHAAALEITQDRIREKRFIRKIGLATAPFVVAQSPEDLIAGFTELTPPLMVKRAVFGYDGKGQVEVHTPDQAQAAFAVLQGVPCVLEEKVALVREISVVLGRTSNGETVFYPVVENIHDHGILSMSLCPARIEPQVQHTVYEMAGRLAQALEYCGVMAVEFFETQAGKVLVNEIAPRPHNSGHYTLDACITSQFEQQVRMVCGLAPGSLRLLSPVAMINLLGDLWHAGTPDWSKVLCHANAKLHLYGKVEARPGRKMGHFCVLDEDLDAARQTARAILAALKGS